MSSVKVVIRKNKTADDKYPLVIRIIKDRKTSYIGLGHHVKESDWDKDSQRVKKSHPNSTRLNNLIVKKLAEAMDSTLELEAAKQNVSVQSVRQKIKPSASSSVFAQADLYLKRLKDEGKFNRFSGDKSRVKHLKEFLKTDTGFHALTVAVIERFKSYLKITYGMSERSAVNHLVLVRSLFSQAIKEGACDEKYYPFGKGKIKIKFPDSIKIGLSLDEVNRLETAELSPQANDARNVWLVSYYFAGMRVSDVLRLTWFDFNDGRLTYKMGKNDKAGSLKTPEKAAAILKQYEALKENKDDVIFPYLKGCDLTNKFATQAQIASRTRAIDAFLKNEVAIKAKIDKNLTMHLARHTFAQMAGDRIPLQMLQKLYRHSSITTTIGYQSNFINRDADDALDTVLGL